MGLGNRAVPAAVTARVPRPSSGARQGREGHAKDWTLGEQKAVAEDIAAKGEASPAYAKAKAAMDAGTEFSMKLTDGKTLTYRIIGINLDDPAGNPARRASRSSPPRRAFGPP